MHMGFWKSIILVALVVGEIGEVFHFECVRKLGYVLKLPEMNTGF